MTLKCTYSSFKLSSLVVNSVLNTWIRMYYIVHNKDVIKGVFLQRSCNLCKHFLTGVLLDTVFSSSYVGMLKCQCTNRNCYSCKRFLRFYMNVEIRLFIHEPN